MDKNNLNSIEFEKHLNRKVTVVMKNGEVYIGVLKSVDELQIGLTVKDNKSSYTAYLAKISINTVK